MFRQQIFPFIFAENTHGQADKGPQMDHAIAAAVVLTEFMNLGVTVVTAGNAIVGSGGLNLIDLLSDQIPDGLLYIRTAENHRHRRNNNCWSGWAAYR